jgi:hypothetical protein
LSNMGPPNGPNWRDCFHSLPFSSILNLGPKIFWKLRSGMGIPESARVFFKDSTVRRFTQSLYLLYQVEPGTFQQEWISCSPNESKNALRSFTSLFCSGSIHTNCVLPARLHLAQVPAPVFHCGYRAQTSVLSWGAACGKGCRYL